MASVARGESRDKQLERAQGFAQRGAYGRAIAVLEELLGANGTDDRILVRLADYKRRAFDDAGAADAFCRAAAVHAGRGFHARAAAALQQALVLQPEDLGIVERLADTKAALHLPREAAHLLDQVATAVGRSGDRARALALRRKIHGYLPADPAAAVRLADELIAGDAKPEAIGVLEAIAATLQDPATQELWCLVEERLADLRPADPARAKELGRVLLSRGSPKRALQRLKPCVAADPGDVEALVLLARAFDALGLGEKVIAAWKEIAKAHHRAGRLEDSHAAWLHVRELAPADHDAAAALPKPELPPRAPTATFEEDLSEADFFAAEGVVDEARAILERLASLNPDDPRVAERLEALDVERVSVDELIPDEEELGDVGEKTGETTTGVLARAAAAHPPHAADGAAHRQLAAAHIELEKYDDALAEIAMAVAADPTQAAACHILAGRCAFARGAPREAVLEYQAALDAPGIAFDEVVDVLCELGHCHELTGELDEAARCFAEARRLEPSVAGEETMLTGAGPA
jgi:tetratricopeptide (TPR) repeat protein